MTVGLHHISIHITITLASDGKDAPLSRDNKIQRLPDGDPKSASEIAQAPEDAPDEGPLIVFMLQVDSPEAEARLKRAFRLILKAAGGDGLSV